MQAAPAPAPPPAAREIGTYTTFSDGRKGVKEETDLGQNPQKLWKTVPGSSERRGRAKWTCSAHVGCKVELVLKRSREGGFTLSRNDAKHTKEPPGGSKR